MNIPPPKMLYVWIFCILIAFIYSSFMIWSDAEIKATNYKNELNRLTKPDIRPEITWFLVTPFPNDQNAVGVFLIITVRNFGAITTLDNWRTEIKLKNGITIPGRNHLIPERMDVNKMTYFQKDSISIRTVSPLDRGSKIVGLHWVKFDDYTEERFDAEVEEIKISCKDAYDNEYSSGRKLASMYDNPDPGYIPGLTPP